MVVEALESRHLLSAAHVFNDFVPPTNVGGEIEWWHRQTQADDAITGRWSGSRNTIVAVMDDGVEYAHGDLADRIWINQGEIPSEFQDGNLAEDGQGIEHDDELEDVDNDGFITFADLNHAANSSKEDVNGNPLTPTAAGIPGIVDAADLLAPGSPWLNGVDDDALLIDLDGDGDDDQTIDDLFGWDFSLIEYDSDGSVSNPGDPSPGDHDPLPDPAEVHGTTVARIIGAEAGDGGDLGFAPRISLLPIKVHTGADYAALSHQWMSALGYLKALKATTNIVAVNVSLRISVRNEGNAAEDPDFIRSDQANSAVEDLVAQDIAYIDSAGNKSERFSEWEPDYFPFWEDLVDGLDAVSGKWSPGTGEHDHAVDVTRYLQSPGAIIVAASKAPPVGERDDPDPPDALWSGSNRGLTNSYSDLAQIIVDDINEQGLEEDALPPNQDPVEFVEQYYLKTLDGPLDTDLTGPDTGWTAHGADIAAPQDIFNGFTQTSAATPLVTATVALIKSLIPSLPITTRQDISERVTNDYCDSGATRGVVEHILCEASEILEFAKLVDGRTCKKHCVSWQNLVLAATSVSRQEKKDAWTLPYEPERNS